MGSANGDRFDTGELDVADAVAHCGEIHVGIPRRYRADDRSAPGVGGRDEPARTRSPGSARRRWSWSAHVATTADGAAPRCPQVPSTTTTTYQCRTLRSNAFDPTTTSGRTARSISCEPTACMSAATGLARRGWPGATRYLPRPRRRGQHTDRVGIDDHLDVLGVEPGRAWRRRARDRTSMRARRRCGAMPTTRSLAPASREHPSDRGRASAANGDPSSGITMVSNTKDPFSGGQRSAPSNSQRARAGPSVNSSAATLSLRTTR